MSLLTTALCSVDEIEQQINDGDNFSANNILVVENLINLATQFAERYIGRDIKTRGTDATQYFDIKEGQTEIYAKNYPIIGVTSLTEDGTVLTVDDDFIYYADQGRFVKGTDYPAYWTTGLKKVVLVYEGGYATVPEDLKQWCIEVVSYMFEAREDGNLQSERVGDISVTYGKAIGAESIGNIINQKSYLKQVLDFYKGNFI